MSILIEVLKQPQTIKKFTCADWNRLISQARAEKLCGRIYHLLLEQNLDEYIPKQAIPHFESAYKLFERQKLDVIREVTTIVNGLESLNCTILKGAAYIFENLPCHYGRLLSDIDVLVPKENLKKAEIQLMKLGWFTQSMDEYDEAYYRTWMHEIPPMRHSKRNTIIDLHHNILPLTSRHFCSEIKLNTSKIKGAVFEGGNILSNTDIVIHSAVHLFTESEYSNGLRDLSDLDILIRHYKKNDIHFVRKVINRANKLNVSPLIWLALRYTKVIFETPIENFELSDLKQTKNTYAKRAMYDFLFINLFKPNHKSTQNWKTLLAKYILYWRGHLIRMPLKLLMPHLLKKSWKRIHSKSESNKKNEELLP